MKKQKLKRYLSQDLPKMEFGSYVSLREVTEATQLHWHNYLEIEIITQGTGVQYLNGQRQALSRGSISILRLTDYHQLIPDDTLHIANISLDEKILSPDILWAISSFSQATFFDISVDGFKTLESICLLCLEENKKLNPNTSYLNKLLNCFFIKLFDLVEIDLKHISKNANDSSPINAALQYLHTNFRKNPSLKTVAKIAHYNESHFCTTFHSVVGMPYISYLTNLKVNYAKELLASTDLKITEICFECGFSSHSAFLRAFNSIVGMTPQAFRQNVLKPKR